MRVTRRGGAVLLVGALLLLIGWWGPYPLPAALGAAAVAAVAAAPLFTARGVVARVERVIEQDRVERGRPVTATLRVHNGSGRRQGAFHVTDTLGRRAHTLRVDALAPGGEAVHRYDLPTGPRGRYAVGPLLLHRADPFGLARRQLPAGGVGTVWVHPRRLPAHALTGGDPRHRPGEDGAGAVPRGSADLADVREYVPGDEVRHLHWTATARTGRLMVRDLVDPRPGRFTVLLDTRARVLTPAAFEEAVDVAASLVCAAVGAGQHARLVLPGPPEQSAANLPAANLPGAPGPPRAPDLAVHGGPRAVRRFLDAVAELRQGGAPNDPLVPGRLSAGTAPHGGALAVVTAGALGVDAAARLRHRFTAVVVIALAGPAPLPGAGVGVRVLRADDAATAVRRWNAAAR